MINRLSHFAIYVDDITRSKNFYGNVFDCGFQSYGPPDFLQIKSHEAADADTIGALQVSSYSPVPEKITGFECTIRVADIDAIIARITANNGTIVMPKTAIPHVGWIVKFRDPDGNLVCAMQYL